MKIKELLKTICLLSCAAFLLSCASSAPVPQAAAFQMSDFSHTIPLFQDDSGLKPCMNFSFSLLETIGSQEDIRFINDSLYQGQNPAQYRDAVIQDWQARYLENRDLAASQDPVPEVLNWEYWETMEFNLLKDRGLVLRREIYAYTGGAHGMTQIKYFVFDLAAHRILKFSDFFREDTAERLQGIVIEGLRRYNNTQDGPKLSENQPLSQGIFSTDTPGLPDIFFINSEGFGLQWAQYDIAPYMAGAIGIILPWREIRPLLKHDTMELLEKFGIPMFI